MEVKLLAFTPWPEYVCYIASRTCRSTVGPIEMHDTHAQTPEMIASHIRARLKDGHTSVFEHVSFTFGIEGISRTCSHQLVRHRIGCSYSQQSQRYTPMEQEDNLNDMYVIPESFIPKGLGGCTAMQKLKGYLRFGMSLYNDMIKAGIPKEDARFVLPQATTTNLMVTMNGRSLLHFFSLRLDKSAQWEIQLLAQKMLEAVKEVAPLLFGHLDRGD